MGSSGGGGAQINGIALGTAGSGIFAGFNLLWGDDFNALPTRYNGGASPVAQYSSSSPHNGARHLTDRTYRQVMIDPAYRGFTSTSPAALGFDPVTVSGGVATITAQPIPSGLTAYLPTDYSPTIMSGALDTWPSFLVSAAGDFIVRAKIRFSAGIARGWWPSFWTTTVINWPNEGEIDVMEASKSSTDGSISNRGSLHESTSDGTIGTGDSNVSIFSARAIPANQFVTYTMKKQGTTLYFYDDSVTPGTDALVTSYTNATLVPRIRGAHRIRLELNVSESWDTSTFTQADWASGVTMDIDYWQCWVTTARYAPFVAHTVLPAVNVASGGSWASSFPSTASLYGSAPDIETICPMFDNQDCPGQAAKTLVSYTLYTPGGMTIDATARTISGTVPSDRGGATGLLFMGSFAAGGQARAAIKMFNVAPAAQVSLFDAVPISYAQAVSQTIAFADFHSGNLGPHSYTTSNDSGGWLTASYGGSNQSVTLSGTAPSSDQTVNVTINCTNAIGQTTTVVRTLVVSTALLFTDNFNRADQSDLADANWTYTAGGVGYALLKSNSVQYIGSNAVGCLYKSPDLASQRQYVQATMFAAAAGFIALQATDASNYIGIRRNNTTNVIEVYTRVADALAAQCAFAETVGDTDVIYLGFIGGVLTVKKNGTTLTPTSGSLTVSSLPPASTRTGLVFRLNSAIPMFDNYQAGTL